MNLHFKYEKEPLISILLDALESRKIKAYSDIADAEPEEISPEFILQRLQRIDTIRIIDPVTQTDTFKVVQDDFDPASILGFLIEEVWYFDKKHSTMRVQIPGIAPVQKRDLAGTDIELPLFWMPYSTCIPILSNKLAYLPFDGKKLMSWYDVFEMRFFDGHVVKEENVRDRSLSDYLTGTNRLRESENIDQSIFNFGEDLWSR